jgi:hypothetical protein
MLLTSVLIILALPTYIDYDRNYNSEYLETAVGIEQGFPISLINTNSIYYVDLVFFLSFSIRSTISQTFISAGTYVGSYKDESIFDILPIRESFLSIFSFFDNYRASIIPIETHYPCRYCEFYDNYIAWPKV